MSENFTILAQDGRFRVIDWRNPHAGEWYVLECRDDEGDWRVVDLHSSVDAAMTKYMKALSGAYRSLYCDREYPLGRAAYGRDGGGAQ